MGFLLPRAAAEGGCVRVCPRVQRRSLPSRWRAGLPVGCLAGQPLGGQFAPRRSHPCLLPPPSHSHPSSGSRVCPDAPWLPCDPRWQLPPLQAPLGQPPGRRVLPQAGKRSPATCIAPGPHRGHLRWGGEQDGAGRRWPRVTVGDLRARVAAVAFGVQTQWKSSRSGGQWGRTAESVKGCGVRAGGR